MSQINTEVKRGCWRKVNSKVSEDSYHGYRPIARKSVNRNMHHFEMKENGIKKNERLTIIAFLQQLSTTMAKSQTTNIRLISTGPDRTVTELPPISGYQKEPLVPLRLACQPLKGILNDELDKFIKNALEQCKTPKDGLTQDESASIYLYTTEWTIRQHSLYYHLNATLRDRNRDKLRPWYSYLKLFLTAFYKLP